MSIWGAIEADFKADRDIEWVIREDLPTGSEDGPIVHTRGPGHSLVAGRLRDVSDLDSFRVLAWFVRVCEWVYEADLTWEIDGGPRYRYEWRAGILTRLRGVLE